MKNYIGSTLLIVALLGISLNAYSVTVKPQSSFGVATDVRVGTMVTQNGTKVDLIAARNARGDIFVGQSTYTPDGTHYRADSSFDTRVRSATNGAVSNGTVKATIEHKVPKRAVTDEIFKKAKVAGRALGKGAAGLGRAAARRHPLGLAFALALEGLAGSKMFWDDEKGDFVKPDDGENYYLFLTNEANSIGSSMTESDFNRWCAGTVTIHASYDSKIKGTQRTCEDIEIVKKSELTTEKYLEKCGGTKEEKYELNAHRACVKDNKLLGKAVKVVRYVGYVPITADDFFRESVPDADKNTNEWVDTSEVKADDPSVTVPAGTVAQTDPYTDPRDGKAKQTRWDFDTGGRVRETEIERPDLTPDSPEAPELKPPLETPSVGQASEPEAASEPQAASQPNFDLCKEHPEILACQQMGEIKEEDGFFDEIKIPQVTDERTWEEDRFLPNNGTCPAPKVFHVWGKPFQVSYEPLCSLMQQVRFIILVAFIVMSAYLVFGSLFRKD